MSKSPWKVCHLSRKEIDRAGSILRDETSGTNIFRYFGAYSAMDSWRASHAFPLNTLQMTLRRRATKVDSSSEVVQRLKRAPSVISKLRRFPDMKLSRMQDLGGCRAIISSVDQLYDLIEEYRRSRDRHELATERDYIAQPQSSGYRGVHLIYKYFSDRSEIYNDYRVEVQIRTKIQHAWATAVEIAGIYVRTPLKSSIGPEDWLEFFRYASSAFSILEDAVRLHSDSSEDEVFNTLRQIESSLDARNKLRNFTGAHEYLAQNRRKSDSHFILILDLQEQKTTIEAYGSVTRASARYAELEKAHIEDTLTDVVLVAAESIDSVTNAYPNYFVDTSQFLSLLDRALERS